MLLCFELYFQNILSLSLLFSNGSLFLSNMIATLSKAHVILISVVGVGVMAESFAQIVNRDWSSQQYTFVCHPIGKIICKISRSLALFLQLLLRTGFFLTDGQNPTFRLTLRHVQS
jgi:hypothetical protein